MKYQEFFEKTKEVELYPFSAQVRSHNNLKLDYISKGVRVVSGLYFPNEEQIIDLWKNLATYEQRNDLKVYDKIYDVKFFVEGLFNTINAPFIASLIRKPLNFAASSLAKSPAYKSPVWFTAQQLTDVVGECYEKTELLENDIRIKALEINPKINMIVEFKPALVGYIGIPMIGKYK